MIHLRNLTAPHYLIIAQRELCQRWLTPARKVAALASVWSSVDSCSYYLISNPLTPSQTFALDEKRCLLSLLHLRSRVFIGCWMVDCYSASIIATAWCCRVKGAAAFYHAICITDRPSLAWEFIQAHLSTLWVLFYFFNLMPPSGPYFSLSLD